MCVCMYVCIYMYILMYIYPEPRTPNPIPDRPDPEESGPIPIAYESRYSCLSQQSSASARFILPHCIASAIQSDLNLLQYEGKFFMLVSTRDGLKTCESYCRASLAKFPTRYGIDPRHHLATKNSSHFHIP